MRVITETRSEAGLVLRVVDDLPDDIVLHLMCRHCGSSLSSQRHTLARPEAQAELRAWLDAHASPDEKHETPAFLQASPEVTDGPTS